MKAKAILISLILALSIAHIALAEELNGKQLFELAGKYETGRGAKKDFNKALEFYTKSAEQEYALAQSTLGYFYMYGEGVGENFALALKWNREAAMQGDFYGEHNLAVMYDEGLGVPQNKEEANTWYAKAAEQGYSPSQLNLAVNYYKGEGVEKNYEKAWNLLNEVRMNSPIKKARWRTRSLLDQIKSDLRVNDKFGKLSYPSWEELRK